MKEQQQAKDLNVDENEYARFEADVYSGAIKEDDIRLQASTTTSVQAKIRHDEYFSVRYLRPATTTVP